MRRSFRVFVGEGALNESPELPEAVRTELQDLSSELEAVGPLVDKLSIVDPDEVELRAIAATLHAFYNGVERVIIIIAKHYGETPGESQAWGTGIYYRAWRHQPTRGRLWSTDRCATGFVTILASGISSAMRIR